MDFFIVVDMEFIVSILFLIIDKDIVKKMVVFNNYVSINLYFFGFFELVFI